MKHMILDSNVERLAMHGPNEDVVESATTRITTSIMFFFINLSSFTTHNLFYDAYCILFQNFVLLDDDA